MELDKLAPIVLFVYNRPWHVEQTLNFLMLNEFAVFSKLYIYSDGPKEGSTSEQLNDIYKVRQIIRSKQWCKEVYIFELPTNKGLANSIINGVTEIINIHERVIVLEDDLITSSGFLRFMNEAMELYKDDSKVAGITGFSFVKSTDETFFLHVGNSLGWGTWKRVWDKTNFNTDFWLKKFNNKDLISKFNLNNTYDYFQMLKDQNAGKTNSWAISFYCSYFFNNQVFLYPGKTLLSHIGYDTGTNCFGGKKSDPDQVNQLCNSIYVEKIAVVEKKENFNLLINYYKETNTHNLIRHYSILINKLNIKILSFFGIKFSKLKIR